MQICDLSSVELFTKVSISLTVLPEKVNVDKYSRLSYGTYVRDETTGKFPFICQTQYFPMKEVSFNSLAKQVLNFYPIRAVCDSWLQEAFLHWHLHNEVLHTHKHNNNLVLLLVCLTHHSLTNIFKDVNFLLLDRKLRGTALPRTFSSPCQDSE